MRTALLTALLLGNFLTGCNATTANSADTASYSKLLAISSVKSYYHTEPKSQTRYPLVEGSLTNLGPKKLVLVEFTLRFKDSRNRVIHEERTYPVYVSKQMGRSPTEALEPSQKMRFAFKAPRCPDTWQAGQVSIEITKVRFAE
jgi:hypothetical protein